MHDFLSLDREEQADIITAAAARLGRNLVVLQKDLWVCWALQTLFNIPNRVEMAFKGGTSLSKVFNVIHRFSEDVDVTLDYRNWGDDLDPFSVSSRTQQKIRCEKLKERVGQYVHQTVLPHFEERLFRDTKGVGTIEVSEDGEKLYVTYPSVFDESVSYIADRVFVEFGGRNITEPKESYTIKPYLSEIVGDLELPTAVVDVLSPKRTFWEKATLIHVECHRNRGTTPERMSRHWYDMAMLLNVDIGNDALKDVILLRDVLYYKRMFFGAAYANYDACIEGGFRLIPEGPLLSSLREDYGKMISSGLFDLDPPTFEEIVQVLEKTQERINEEVLKASP